MPAARFSAGPASRSPSWPFCLLAVAVVALVAGGCAGLGGPPGTGAGEEALSPDPALVTGVLDNGLSYIVRRHQNPPGRVAIWLHVASGSLNETEATRGIAHYLEHMAFNGSANFPPGSVVPFFQALGLSFGRDQNAFTSFDQTVYTLALPQTRPETLDRGLLFLSDVAFRLNLSPKQIDDERQIILEERRARLSPRQRVFDVVLERLAPESTLGRRLPIGTEAAIRKVGQAEFRDYYTRWYVPSNMTVIVVGDVEPAVMVEAIGRHFGAAPRAPRPARRPVGLKPHEGLRAIVATDPELTQAEVSLTRVEPTRPPVTTVPALRRQLAEDLGAWMFNRRVEADLAAGQVAFQRGDASIARWTSAVRVVSAGATAAPERWASALTDLGIALARARRYGFTPAELEEARLATTARLEQTAQQESTLPARALLRQINESVNRREPPMSAAQRLAITTRLLPDISAEEASRVFAEVFDPANVAAVLTLPSSAGPPSEPRLRELARAALDVSPAPLLERPRPTSLLASPPPGGAVVEERQHEETAVWSGWLDNGVRVHHRRVDQRKNQATITITLAGGTIEERPDSRGVTEAAVRAWDRPASSRLSSTQIRTLMTGKKVRVHGSLTADTLGLAVSGDPAALETGLELAYLLLTDPLVEAAGFEQWREEKLQEIADLAVQPRGVLAQAQADAFFPAGEARLRPVTAAQVRALSRDATQAWLAELVKRAPIEVAVVGDIDRDRAVALVARYLGSLPARPRIGGKTLAELRPVPRPRGPIRLARTVATQTDQAQVLGGFFGADVQDVRDARLLVLAARVLTTRMSRAIREERQLVYSIGASSRPGEAYPGFGLFVTQAPTEPAKVEPLSEVVDEMLSAFAKSGPTEDELKVAKGQMANIVDEAIKGPDFWVDRLAAIDYRGMSLDDIARIAADYQRFTADEVREAFARYARPEARFRITILPERPS